MVVHSVVVRIHPPFYLNPPPPPPLPTPNFQKTQQLSNWVDQRDTVKAVLDTTSIK